LRRRIHAHQIADALHVRARRELLRRWLARQRSGLRAEGAVVLEDAHAEQAFLAVFVHEPLQGGFRGTAVAAAGVLAHRPQEGLRLPLVDRVGQRLRAAPRRPAGCEQPQRRGQRDDQQAVASKVSLGGEGRHGASRDLGTKDVSRREKIIRGGPLAHARKRVVHRAPP
jgi:hypothetical protein